MIEDLRTAITSLGNYNRNVKVQQLGVSSNDNFDDLFFDCVRRACQREISSDNLEKIT